MGCLASKPSPCLSIERSKDDRQMLDPTQARWRKRGTGSKLDVLKAIQQSSEHDPRFQPRQARPDAHMRAGDKGEMRVGFALGANTVRVVKHAFAAVAGGQNTASSLSLAGTLSTHLAIARSV